MNWPTVFATYFIVWWTVLFAVLPFGLKTQAEKKNVVVGSEPSAPHGPHFLRASLWTTLVSAVLMGGYIYLSYRYNFGFDTLSDLLPKPPHI